MSYKFFSSKFAKQSRFHWDFIKNLDKLNEWEIISRNFDFFLTKKLNKDSITEKIPKIIHQIWIGPRKLPKKYAYWSKTWRELNPDWEYKLWTENEIKKISLINHDLFIKSSNIGFKSDLLRYEILKQFGGLYVDTDFECIKPIPNNFLRYDFVSCIVFSKRPEIANGMMMSKVNSKIIEKIISDMKINKYLDDPIKTITSSGPIYLTKKYFSLAKDEKEKCLILPSNYFYPFPNFLINKFKNTNDFISNETIGLHHWEMSWIKGNLVKRIIRKLKIIFKFKII